MKRECASRQWTVFTSSIKLLITGLAEKYKAEIQENRHAIAGREVLRNFHAIFCESLGIVSDSESARKNLESARKSVPKNIRIM